MKPVALLFYCLHLWCHRLDQPAALEQWQSRYVRCELRRFHSVGRRRATNRLRVSALGMIKIQFWEKSDGGIAPTGTVNWDGGPTVVPTEPGRPPWYRGR